jgi:hypothetical protein
MVIGGGAGSDLTVHLAPGRNQARARKHAALERTRNMLQSLAVPVFATPL